MTEKMGNPEISPWGMYQDQTIGGENAMSMYTTGELAKLCKVSVRTVQYYDSRDILKPSQLSEGGRRLYSEEDLRKMQIICFLREMDLPINAIGELFREEHPEIVIALILSQQQQSLEKDVEEKRAQLVRLEGLQKQLKTIDHFSLESIGDIAKIMHNKEKLRKLHTVLLATAIPFGIMEWTSIALWIIQKIWWPFAVYSLLFIPYLIWLVGYYLRRTAYICPECHQVFQPKKRDFFLSSGNFTARKLTCPCCGRRGYCVETCSEELEM